MRCSNSAVIPRRAAGYFRTGNDFNNADLVHMSIPHVAGALYSTTADLLRWQRGLYANKVLTAASLQKMTTAQFNGYGFGLEIDAGGKRKVFSHGGGIDGFNTMLACSRAVRLCGSWNIIRLRRAPGHSRVRR